MQNLYRKFFPAVFTALFLASCVGSIDPDFSFIINRRFPATIFASAAGIDTTLRFNIADTLNEFQNQSTSRDRVVSATLLKLGAQSTTSLSAFDSIEYFVAADA